MQISLSLARKAVFGTAAVAAALMLSACGGGGDDKLIHVQFKIESITKDGACEKVSVVATPKNLAANQGSLSATKFFYTEVNPKQIKPEDVACVGEATSAQSPGTGVWEFKVRMGDFTAVCERDVQIPAEGQPEMVLMFKDGVEGCG